MSHNTDPRYYTVIWQRNQTLRCIFTERTFAQTLRSLLAPLPIGEFVPDSKDLRSALSHLEWSIPGWITEVHAEWMNYTLDGISPELVRKTGHLDAHLAGFLILIDDQTLIAFDLNIQIAKDLDEISWLEIKIGEKGQTGMVRLPHGGMSGKRSVAARLETINWMYHVGFGTK